MRRLLLVCILMLTPSAGGWAALMPGLYVGEAAVADQGAGERGHAMPMALQNVLQKLTGLRRFDDYPELRSALKRAPDMVLSYHYRKVEQMLPDGSLNEELNLVAQFAEAPVDNLARELGLPLWQPQRLSATAWLIVDDGLDRRIMPIEYDYARQRMAVVAERRGLPLDWPRPDADGLYAVDEQILWGGYAEELAGAAGRGVLIATARREGAEWVVRFNLSYQDDNWSWRQDDVDLAAGLEEGMHETIDRVAAANMIQASDLGSWKHDLTVSGLASVEDYRRCLNYLQSMSLVEDVGVVTAQPGRVTFRATLSASPPHFEKMLESGGVLRKLDEQADGGYFLIGEFPDEI